MKVTITGRKCSPRPSFEKTVQERMNKFDRFFQDDAAATVTATLEKNRFRVEVTIKSRGFLFRTERTSTDLEVAFSDAADLIMRQIVKNKEKLGSRVRSREVDLVREELSYTAEEEEDGTDYRIVREKTFKVVPMTEQEATLQMDMLGHDFYVFRNSVTGALNIVYRRHEDDSYGLLIPTE